MSFWDGFQRGFDWGYQTTGRVMSNRDLKKLQEEKEKGVTENLGAEIKPQMSPVAQQPDQLTQLGLGNQQPQGLMSPVESQPTGLSAEMDRLINPNVQRAPSTYTFMGQEYDTSPNLFQQRQAYQNRVGDVYERWGQFDRARAARDRAMDAEARGLSFANEQTRLELAQNRDARDATRAEQEATRFEQETAEYERQRGIQTRMDEINATYADILSGKLTDPELIWRDVAPLFNDPSLNDLPGTLEQNKDGVWMYTTEDGQSMSASQMLATLSQRDRNDVLGLAQQYALYNVDGSVERFNAINNTLYRRAQLKQQANAASRQGSIDQRQRFTNMRNSLVDDRNSLIGMLAETGDPGVRQGLMDQIDEVNRKITYYDRLQRQAFDNETGGVRLTVLRKKDGSMFVRMDDGSEMQVEMIDPNGAPDDPLNLRPVEPKGLDDGKSTGEDTAAADTTEEEPRVGLTRQQRRQQQNARRAENQRLLSQADALVEQITALVEQGNKEEAMALFTENEQLLSDANDASIWVNPLVIAKRKLGLIRSRGQSSRNNR